MRDCDDAGLLGACADARLLVASTPPLFLHRFLHAAFPNNITYHYYFGMRSLMCLLIFDL